MEGKVVNRRSITCHGLNLVLDLDQNVLKRFLPNNSLYLLVSFLEPLLMYP